MALFDINGNDRTDLWEWLVLFIGLNYLAEKHKENPGSRAAPISNVQAGRRSLVWGLLLSPLLFVPALLIHVSTIPELTDEAYRDFAQTYEHERARSGGWVVEREIEAQVRVAHGLEGFPISAGVLALGVPYGWWRWRRSRKLLTRPYVDPWFHHHGDVLAHSHPHRDLHTHGPDGSMLRPHPPAHEYQAAQTYVDNPSLPPRSITPLGQPGHRRPSCGSVIRVEVEAPAQARPRASRPYDCGGPGPADPIWTSAGAPTCPHRHRTHLPLR